MPSPDEVKKLIEDAGGEVKEMGVLPDNSGFAIGSFPLPKTHWLYQGDRTESYGVFNIPPMVFRMGSKQRAMVCIDDGPTDPNDAGFAVGTTMTKQAFAEQIRKAGKYAVRTATMNGQDMDFDPDALLQNLVVGFLGYWTETGLSSDEWDNP